MINISNAYRTAINNSANWHERVVFELSSGSTLTATNANIWQGGLSIEDTVSGDGLFEIGGTHINQATIVLYNGDIQVIEDVDFNLDSDGCLIMDGNAVTYSAIYDSVDFSDAVVKVYVNLPGFPEIQKGEYNVVDWTKDDGIITITCYDNMHLMSRLYDSSTDTALTFPATLANIITWACANCDIACNTLVFPHSTLSISEKPSNFDSLTYREIVGYVAQIAVCFARCNNVGQLELKWFDLNNTHSISSMYSHHEGEEVEITGVKLNQRYTYTTTTVLDDGTTDTSSEERDVGLYAGTDGYIVSLDYNPLIEMANAQTICNWIGTEIIGMQFSIYDLSKGNDPTIEAGDYASVTDRKNQTRTILISHVTFTTGDYQQITSNAPRPSQTKIVRPSNYARNYEELRAQLLAQQAERQSTAAGIANSADDAKKVADNYISADSTGVMVADLQNGTQTPSTATGENVLITSTDMQVRNGQTAIATFGSTITLGASTVETRITSSSFDINYSTTEIVHFGYGNGNAEIGTADAPYYTLGERKSSSVYGNYSVAEGYNVTASAYASHAEGSNTVASGNESHAEGVSTTASGYYSHAEGSDTEASNYYAHAEGCATEATGTGSHAEGLGALASGDYSHAQGRGTIAASAYQTVIGKYNVSDSNDTYAFIIGKGTSDNSRSNLLALTWSGILYINGKTVNTVATSLTDGLMSLTDKRKLDGIGGWDHASNSFTNKSVASGTSMVNLGSFTLAAGYWIVYVNAIFASNATGRRALNISESSGGSAISEASVLVVPPVSGTDTRIQLVYFLHPTASTTYYANVYQNSGSTLTVQGRYGTWKICND